LLFLGAPRPKLPLLPSSKFGRWWFRVEDWIAHVKIWRAKDNGVSLSDDDLMRLGKLLGVTQMPTEEEAEEQQAQDVSALEGFGVWLTRLADSISDLNRRVAALEARAAAIDALAQTNEPTARTYLPTASSSVRETPWTDQERRALNDALASLPLDRNRRTLPPVIQAMNTRLGYELKSTNYNGYGTARTMFDRGRSDGLLVYGPAVGIHRTVYRPGEHVPST
jgi:hypothetical protein